MEVLEVFFVAGFLFDEAFGLALFLTGFAGLTAFFCVFAVFAAGLAVFLAAGFFTVDVFFAVAAGFALVVMQDAAGLRRAAGKIASSLNKLKDDIYAHNTQATGERLKELLGHTPIEVFAGALWGFFTAWLLHFNILPGA